MRSALGAIALQAKAESPRTSIRRCGKRSATSPTSAAARSCWEGRRPGFGFASVGFGVGSQSRNSTGRHQARSPSAAIRTTRPTTTKQLPSLKPPPGAVDESWCQLVPCTLRPERRNTEPSTASAIGASGPTKRSIGKSSTSRPRRSGHQAARAKKSWAREWCRRPASRAACHIPVTVRSPTRPRKPWTSAPKIWKVGALKAGRSRDRIAVSEDGRAGIGGDLLEGCLDTSLVRASRRCSLLLSHPRHREPISFKPARGHESRVK